MKEERLKTKNMRGFTLFFAVLVTSLVLAVGLSIFNITIKEITLSSDTRESFLALYAADSGIECAIFWDVTEDSFVEGTPIECQGVDVPISGPGSGPWIFTLDNFGTAQCTTVTITKDIGTTIQARGYNTCDTDNPRRVERALQVSY